MDNDKTGVILLLGGEKGGSGKSCIAQNLAAVIKNAGGDVLLLDADPQSTTYDWATERAQHEDLVPIPAVKAHGNIRQTLMDLRVRYRHIVVDSGGADSEALRSAMTLATHMLIPFRPKRRDLKTLPKVSNLVQLASAINPGLSVHSIITQCPSLPSQGSRIMDAKDACKSYGINPLAAITFARNVYDDADEHGSSVVETEVDLKAKAEVQAIADELWEGMVWA